MGKITKYLNQLIIGNVFDDPEILESYSTDRSVLKIKPKFVAFPESTEDIQKLMRFFNQIASRNIPVSVTPWGSGLDEGGADLSSGLIISTEKLGRLLEIDTRERLVRVQAGITLKELNTALSVSGLTIPIGGHDRDTIGGLIANVPIDSYQSKYGGIRQYVERIEVILSNGECLQTSRYRKYALAKKASEKSFEGSIYHKIAKLIKDDGKFLREFDVNKAGLTGYPGIATSFKRDTLDLMPIFYGSQGTLGIISEVILRAVPINEKIVRAVATFRELNSAIKFMDAIQALKPREVDLYNLNILEEARATGKNLDGVIKKLEDGYVIYMTFDERRSYAMRRLEHIRDKMPRSSKLLLNTPTNRVAIREFENALNAYLNHTKDGEHLPILTDFFLPSVNLPSFIKDLEVLEKKLDLKLALFGSYSNSIYSLRPAIKLDAEDFNKKVATFLRAGAYIINRQGGILTGGNPEGRLKAVVTNAEILESTKDFYGKIKKIFDPNNVLNPDVKLGADSRFTLTHLRDKELTKTIS